MSPRPQTETVELHTSDGLRLEAELRVPYENPVAAAVLAHPHPQHGGNMRSLIPGLLFRALPSSGVITLRFNFRGVGNSEGSFADGVDEQLDLVAAIESLSDITSGLALVFAGSSFGADTCLCVTDQRITAWCCIAPPLRTEKLAGMTASSDPRRKLLIVPEHDEFVSLSEAEERTRSWANTKMEIISGADHYLVGRTNRVTELCQGFVREVAG